MLSDRTGVFLLCARDSRCCQWTGTDELDGSRSVSYTQKPSVEVSFVSEGLLASLGVADRGSAGRTPGPAAAD